MAFEIEQIVGSGSVQELVCQTINFGTTIEEIKQIRKTVIIDSCQPVFDKVIINGRLRKDIMFKQAAAGFPIPGTVQGCIGVSNTITGPILDTDLEITFNALIPVPGAQPSDKCVVLQAFVEGESEEPANIQHNGGFTALVNKSIIFICVKVVRELTSGQAAGVGQQVQLCPPRRSTGFFPGGTGLIPPRPGIIPGSFIGPTVTFPGVLNPGIPTLIPPASPVTAPTSSQVQITTPGVLATGTTAGGVTTTGGTVIS
jgi:hypothetical protein